MGACVLERWDFAAFLRNGRFRVGLGMAMDRLLITRLPRHVPLMEYGLGMLEDLLFGSNAGQRRAWKGLFHRFRMFTACLDNFEEPSFLFLSVGLTGWIYPLFREFTGWMMGGDIE